MVMVSMSGISDIVRVICLVCLVSLCGSRVMIIVLMSGMVLIIVS